MSDKGYKADKQRRPSQRRHYFECIRASSPVPYIRGQATYRQEGHRRPAHSEARTTKEPQRWRAMEKYGHRKNIGQRRRDERTYSRSEFKAELKSRLSRVSAHYLLRHLTRILRQPKTNPSQVTSRRQCS